MTSKIAARKFQHFFESFHIGNCRQKNITGKDYDFSYSDKNFQALKLTDYQNLSIPVFFTFFKLSFFYLLRICVILKRFMNRPLWTTRYLFSKCKNHGWIVVIEINKKARQIHRLKSWIFTFTAQKMKFSIKDFSSKCDQIRSKLRIWSYLLGKSSMENFIFCAVIHVSSEIRFRFTKYKIIKLVRTFLADWKNRYFLSVISDRNFEGYWFLYKDLVMHPTLFPPPSSLSPLCPSPKSKTKQNEKAKRKKKNFLHNC